MAHASTYGALSLGFTDTKIKSVNLTSKSMAIFSLEFESTLLKSNVICFGWFKKKNYCNFKTYIQISDTVRTVRYENKRKAREKLEASASRGYISWAGHLASRESVCSFCVLLKIIMQSLKVLTCSAAPPYSPSSFQIKQNLIYPIEHTLGSLD